MVDYGCGQGIAEMVLSDYMASRYTDNDHIKDFILIEPSKQNLQRCVKYVNAFFCESKISVICKKDNQLNNDDINPKPSTVMHIFSNVIDQDDFDGDSVLSMLNGDGGGDGDNSLPWGRNPDEDDRRFAYRCMMQAHRLMKPAQSKRGLGGKR